MSKKTSPPTPPERTQAPPLRQGGLYVDGKLVEPETIGKTHAEIEAEQHAKRVKERTARRPDPALVETKDTVEIEAAQTEDTQPEVSDAPSDSD